MVFAQSQLAGRQWPYRLPVAILFATPALLAPVLAVVSAKMAPASLALAAVSVTAFAVLHGGDHITGLRRGMDRDWSARDGAILSSLAFAGLGALSALWSPVPLVSLLAAMSLLALIAVSYITANLAAGELKQPRLHLAESLWLGLVIVALYYLVDVVNGQAIKITVYNWIGLDRIHVVPKWTTWKNGKIVKIALSDETRNAFALPLTSSAA